MKTDISESLKEYDFTMEQEVLNEWAAGIGADYISYCHSHGIDLDDMSQPMAAKTQLVYDYKRKIIETGECTVIEDLEPIEAKLKELKDYLKEVEGKE